MTNKSHSIKVVKFGGSSLANVESILMARDIVLTDRERTIVVVSAPGKCKEFPYKVTDLLIEGFADKRGESFKRVFDRFRVLSKGLGVNISAEIRRTQEEVAINRKNYDFVVSRGEYLMAILFAKLLGYRFLDSANLIVIKSNGKYHPQMTQSKFTRYIGRVDKIVIGGFYGVSVAGVIKTFPRGGSDYTGAIVTVCLRAEIYENFTDTYGVQTANPALFENTQSISELDYVTMYKLSKAGASVIYPECLPLLKGHSVPLKVDNTFDPGVKPTIIGCNKTGSKYPSCHNKVCPKFFCITYKFEQNINKDMVEIFVAFNKYSPRIADLRKILNGTEVYLTRFEKRELTMITTGENLVAVVGLLHDYFMGL